MLSLESPGENSYGIFLDAHSADDIFDDGSALPSLGKSSEVAEGHCFSFGYIDLEEVVPWLPTRSNAMNEFTNLLD